MELLEKLDNMTYFGLEEVNFKDNEVNLTYVYVKDTSYIWIYCKPKNIILDTKWEQYVSIKDLREKTDILDISIE